MADRPGDVPWAKSAGARSSQFRTQAPRMTSRRLHLAVAATPAGRLWELTKAGLLNASDELIWHRRQQGKTYTAVVRSDGDLTLMGAANAEHDSPSSAAREAAGYEVNGVKSRGVVYDVCSFDMGQALMAWRSESLTSSGSVVDTACERLMTSRPR